MVRKARSIALGRCVWCCAQHECDVMGWMLFVFPLSRLDGLLILLFFPAGVSLRCRGFVLDTCPNTPSDTSNCGFQV